MEVPVWMGSHLALRFSRCKIDEVSQPGQGVGFAVGLGEEHVGFLVVTKGLCLRVKMKVPAEMVRNIPEVANQGAEAANLHPSPSTTSDPSVP